MIEPLTKSNQKLGKVSLRSGNGARLAHAPSRYDAHHTVLSKTYGAFADLRRELAVLFLRAKRSLPPELSGHADLARFAQVEQANREQRLVKQLEEWLSPSK